MRLVPVRPLALGAIPSWTREQVLEHARQIAFVDPESELLAQLRKGGANLDVWQVGPVTLVHAD